MRISDWSSDVCSSDPGQPDGSRSDSPFSCEHATHVAAIVQAGSAVLLGPITFTPPFEGVYANTFKVYNNFTGIQLLDVVAKGQESARSEEQTSELQSLMRISYAVFCLKKKTMI